MCVMTHCFCYIPLRVGCFLIALIESMMAICEIILYYVVITFKINEEEKAAHIVEIFNIQMCAIWLFVGCLTRERVCIILHNAFLGAMLLAELAFEFFVFDWASYAHMPAWAILYYVIFHAFLFYAVIIAAFYGWEIKDANISDDELQDRHRQLSSDMSTQIYGM